MCGRKRGKISEFPIRTMLKSETHKYHFKIDKPYINRFAMISRVQVCKKNPNLMTFWKVMANFDFPIRNPLGKLEKWE